MYGSKMSLATEESGKLEQKILEKEHMTLQQLGRAGASGTRRLGRLIITDMEAKQVKEGIQVSFSLPKGAYATTVLREIMKK